MQSTKAYKISNQTMQAIFDMLELNKRIVQGVVDIIESDDESEASVKMKRLVKLIKSKAYKEK